MKDGWQETRITSAGFRSADENLVVDFHGEGVAEDGFVGDTEEMFTRFAIVMLLLLKGGTGESFRQLRGGGAARCAATRAAWVRWVWQVSG